MDGIFENAPLFIPGTPYAKVGDYKSGERELREGMQEQGDYSGHLLKFSGTFAAGGRDQRGSYNDDEEKRSTAGSHDSEKKQ